MTLDQYIQHLGQLLKDNPEAKDYIVVTSADDERNYFNPVHYSPGIGNFEDGEFQVKQLPANAVCLN